MAIKSGYKQTEIGVIPDDWDVDKVKNKFETSSGGTPARSNPNFFKGSILWVTTTELIDSFIYDSNEKITIEALQKSSAKLFVQKENHQLGWWFRKAYSYTYDSKTPFDLL